MNDLPWMHFADANPLTFWMILGSLGTFAVGIAAAFGERKPRKPRDGWGK